MSDFEKVNLADLVPSGSPLEDFAYIPITPLEDDTLNNLIAISKLLERLGVSLSIDRYPASDEPSRLFLKIQIDEDQFHFATNRNAGRKKDLTMESRYKHCTVAELREMQKDMRKTDIANELGCPRMTLYRIFKNLETADNVCDDDSIWSYTS